MMVRLRLARLLRRLASHLDTEVRPLRIEWADGRKLTLPPGWTFEQAMDLIARTSEWA